MRLRIDLRIHFARDAAFGQGRGWNQVSETIIQFVGYDVKALGREYTFNVKEAGAIREFTLMIANAEFDSRRARYQDAPDICSLKLQRELAACSTLPSKTNFRITETDLDDYREAHLPRKKTSRNRFALSLKSKRPL